MFSSQFVSLLVAMQIAASLAQRLGVGRSPYSRGPPLGAPPQAAEAYSSSSSSALGFASGEPQQEVHKHVFAYVVPDESPAPPIQLGTDIKNELHYKILFIKAPAPNVPALNLPAIAGGPEVRTLVYLLQPNAQKPQLPLLTTGPTPKPAAPQVFFLKYDPKRNEA